MNILYKDIETLIEDNNDIVDLDCQLRWHYDGAVIGNNIIGRLEDNVQPLKIPTENGSFTFRGKCKIGHLIHDVFIKNHYEDGVRYLIIKTKECFYSNKDMLVEAVKSDAYARFPNMQSVLIRAYICLNKITHGMEDVIPLLVMLDKMPVWANDPWYRGVRVVNNPWEAIRLVFQKMDEYVLGLGV